MSKLQNGVKIKPWGESEDFRVRTDGGYGYRKMLRLVRLEELAKKDSVISLREHKINLLEKLIDKITESSEEQDREEQPAIGLSEANISAYKTHDKNAINNLAELSKYYDRKPTYKPETQILLDTAIDSILKLGKTYPEFR